MNKYIIVKKPFYGVLIVSSLLFSFCLAMGLNYMLNIVPNVFATSNINVEEIVVTEERTVIVEKEVIIDNVVKPVSMKEVGSFGLTAYCPCSICCEQWSAPPEGKTTSIGVGAYQGITFAVDPKKIPYGSKIYIEDVGVGIATDCGGAIKNNRIDVYFSNHTDAQNFGVARGELKKVYIIY